MSVEIIFIPLNDEKSIFELNITRYVSPEFIKTVRQSTFVHFWKNV